MTTFKVFYDDSPTGAGKSYRQFDDITGRSCKVLFIIEQTDRIIEFLREIGKRSVVKGSTPTLDAISSKAGNRRNSVASQIKELPLKYADHDHVIVLATHAAMLSSDFSGFDDWEIIVDEVPGFLDFEQKTTHLDQAFFDRYYVLEPFEEGWSKVTLTEEGAMLTPASVRDDDSHSHLAVFHRRVLDASRAGSERIVLCNLSEWAGMSAAKVQWCWASVFSLWELKAFAKVTLLGNRFRADIGSMISASFDDEPIEWIALPSLKGEREFHSRKVHINYFSEDRQASRSLFGSTSGSQMLTEIGSYLAQQLKDVKFIWTANDTTDQYLEQMVNSPKQALESGGLKKEAYLSPRQAGTNTYQNISHAVAIYAAKPAPNLISLLKARGVPVEAWARSMEHETILQFVTRTSVRNAGNSSPVHLWVFDRAQALYLKEYFDGLDYVTATMKVVEDGPEIPERARSGPKAAVRTPEEQAEYLAMKKAKDKERKRRSRAEMKEREAAAKALRKAA